MAGVGRTGILTTAFTICSNRIELHYLLFNISIAITAINEVLRR